MTTHNTASSPSLSPTANRRGSIPSAILVATTGLLLGAATACESDFDPGSRITTLRVLAMQADAPYAAPGERVHLRALVHDPEGRPIDWAWAACVNPPAATVEGCIEEVNRHRNEDGSLPLLASGEGLSELDYVVPDRALEGLDDAALPLAEVGILSVACPGEIEEAAPDALVPFDCRDRTTGDLLSLHEYVIGVKRIHLRSRDRNENPSIARILFDGSEWVADDVPEVEACATGGNEYDDCPKATRHHIEVVVPKSAVEHGKDEFGREYAESVAVQFYSTEGIFENESRIYGETTTGWVARQSASGETVTLYIVVRDDRGGASWEERTVLVR